MSETMERIIPILFAATRQGIVILAGDGGEAEVIPFGLNGTHVTALAADAKGVLLAAGTASQGTLMTRDGGKTFDPAAAAGTGHVVALASSGATIYAASEPAGIHRGSSSAGLKSSAGFATVWRERLAGGTEARITALLVRGTRVLVASDRGSVFLSEDGGEAFREVAGGLPEPVLCLHAPAGSADAVLAGTGDGLYRSGRPGTEPWKHVFSDDDRPAVTAIGSDASGALVCGVARFLEGPRPGVPAGADAALLCSGDGREFRRATIAALPVVRGRVSAVRFAPKEPARVFAGTTAGEVFASRDGGKTFRLAAATIPGVLDLAVGPALV